VNDGCTTTARDGRTTLASSQNASALPLAQTTSPGGRPWRAASASAAGRSSG